MPDRAHKIHLRKKESVDAILKKLQEESTKRQRNAPLPPPPPKEGDLMQDGTIYAGRGKGAKPFYAAPCDVHTTMVFNNAAAFVKQTNDQKYMGFNDWRLPTRAELNILYLFQNEGAFVSTFQGKDHGPKGWYWTSERLNDDVAYDQKFCDGSTELHSVTGSFSSIRLVRG